MSAHRHIMSSESVTEGHPDKIANQISDAVLDAILIEDPTARVACETLVTTGMVVVAGEITTTAYVHVPDVVRETVQRIGYDSGDPGSTTRRARCSRPSTASRRTSRRVWTPAARATRA